MVFDAFGLHGHADDWFVKLHWLKEYGMILVTQSIAGASKFESHGCHDVSCRCRINPLSFVGVHPEQPCNPLMDPFPGVEDLLTNPYSAGIDSQIGHLSALIHHYLKDQGGKWAFCFWGPGLFLLSAWHLP